MSALDQEWQLWLDDNLLRGCHVGDLYKIMRDNGFDISTIQAMMGDAFPVGIETQTDNAPSVDYLALAQTLETQQERIGAKRFDTDLIQLYTIDDFLTPDECAKVIALTQAKLRPSEVSHDNGDKAFRTSMTCHLNDHEDPFVRYIDDKISRALGVRLAY